MVDNIIIEALKMVVIRPEWTRCEVNFFRFFAITVRKGQWWEHWGCVGLAIG